MPPANRVGAAQDNCLSPGKASNLRASIESPGMISLAPNKHWPLTEKNRSTISPLCPSPCSVTSHQSPIALSPRHMKTEADLYAECNSAQLLHGDQMLTPVARNGKAKAESMASMLNGNEQTSAQTALEAASRMLLDSKHYTVTPEKDQRAHVPSVFDKSLQLSLSPQRKTPNSYVTKASFDKCSDIFCDPSSSRSSVVNTRKLLRRSSSTNLRNHGSVFQGLAPFESVVKGNDRAEGALPRKTEGRRMLFKRSNTADFNPFHCRRPIKSRRRQSADRLVAGILKSSNKCSSDRKNLSVSFSTWALFSDDIEHDPESVDRDAAPKQPRRATISENVTGEHPAAFLRKRNNVAATRIQAAMRGGMARLRVRMTLLQVRLSREEQLRKSMLNAVQTKKWESIDKIKSALDAERRQQLDEQQAIVRLKAENAQLGKHNSNLGEMLRLLDAVNKKVRSSTSEHLSASKTLRIYIDGHKEDAKEAKRREDEFKEKITKKEKERESLVAHLEHERAQSAKIKLTLSTIMQTVAARSREEYLLHAIQTIHDSMPAPVAMPDVLDQPESLGPLHIAEKAENTTNNKNCHQDTSLLDVLERSENSEGGFDLTIQASEDDLSVVTEWTRRKSLTMDSSRKRRSSLGESTFVDDAQYSICNASGSIESFAGEPPRRNISFCASSFVDDGMQSYYNLSTDLSLALSIGDDGSVADRTVNTFGTLPSLLDECSNHRRR